MVAFGRCKFKLTPASVGHILHATIGGNPLFFKVSALGDRVFRFSVASKEVGLAIRKTVSFECDLFKLFFHLWGGGGPNWRKEFSLFLEEVCLSWQAPRQSAKLSFADAVRQHPCSSVLSEANAVPLGTARPILTGANAVPRGRSPPLHPLSGANAVPRWRTPPIRQSVLKGVVFPLNSSRAPISVFVPRRRRDVAAMATASCSRCLSLDHVRCDCRWPIRCRACNASGHVTASCPTFAIKRRHAGDVGKEKVASIISVGWFRSPAIVGPSSPLV